MSMERYAELNMYRVRGYIHYLNSSGSFTWYPERDGSFLKVSAGAGGPWTLALTINIPTNPIPPTGMRLWVEFYQGGTGSSLVTWPGPCKFQTAGDAIPAAAMGSTTIWTGIFGVGSTNLFMTKLGEWP
jgi:hypothetical protein